MTTRAQEWVKWQMDEMGRENKGRSVRFSTYRKRRRKRKLRRQAQRESRRRNRS
jgi:hypothetical protein